jgi:DNA primase
MSDLLLDLITDILGEPRESQSRGSQYAFNCPECASIKGVDNDGKYNLEVNLEKNVFNCWSCLDNHGSLKKLVRKWGNKKQRDRIKLLLPEDFTPTPDQPVSFEGLPKEYIFLNSKYESYQKKQALLYLKKRGITESIIEKYRIGFAEYGKYAGRIILPSINKDGIVDYFVSRTYGKQKPKYLNPPTDKMDIIFNEIFLSWYSTIYFVEGPFDHIVTPNSIPGLGKIMSEELLRKIHDNAKADIVILQDGDAWKDSVELYRILNSGKLYGRVKIIKLPEKYDISLIYEKFMDEGVVKVLRNSFQLKEHLI